MRRCEIVIRIYMDEHLDAGRITASRHTPRFARTPPSQVPKAKPHSVPILKLAIYVDTQNNISRYLYLARSKRFDAFCYWLVDGAGHVHG